MQIRTITKNKYNLPNDLIDCLCETGTGVPDVSIVRL